MIFNPYRLIYTGECAKKPGKIIVIIINYYDQNKVSNCGQKSGKKEPFYFKNTYFYLR